MTGVSQKEFASDRFRKLAEECADKAREAADITAADDPAGSLAAKNWSAAALTATQAWMTIERGARR